MGAGKGKTRRIRGSTRLKITNNAEFKKVFEYRKSAVNDYVLIYSRPNTLAGKGKRLGLVANRKVGGAVKRNRVKRILREAFWNTVEVPKGYDYVIVARSKSFERLEKMSFEQVKNDIIDLTQKLVTKK